jgi:hypothetical protein
MRLHFHSAADGAGRATRPASSRGLRVVTSSRRYDACGASVLLRCAGEQEQVGYVPRGGRVLAVLLPPEMRFSHEMLKIRKWSEWIEKTGKERGDGSTERSGRHYRGLCGGLNFEIGRVVPLCNQ